MIRKSYTNWKKILKSIRTYVLKPIKINIKLKIFASKDSSL